MHRFVAFITALTLMPLVASASLGAPPVTVTAELSSNKTYIGDPVLLRINVEGSTTPQQPTLPDMKGLSADFLGGTDASSHSVLIINGRRSDESSVRYIFQYRLTPSRGGVLNVPAISVVVDGTTYTTSPLTLVALEPKQTNDFRLTVTLAKKDAYVSEPIKATITLLLSKPVRNFSCAIAPPEGAFEILPGADPRPPGTQPNDPRFIEVPFLDSTVIGSAAAANIDGRQFTALTITRVVVPRRDGKVTIGPLRAAFDAIIGQRRTMVFEDLLGDRSVTERTVIASEPIELTVKPLPTEGRPANFSGLIGAYSIEASASPTSVNVGDPISLTVTVRGPEPLDLVGPLALDRQRSFTDGFKIPSETVFPKIAGGSATFTYAIRARSDRVTEVPPIELPYFDTTSGAYRTAASRPIPLTVRPTKNLALSGLDDAPGAPVVEDRPGGLAPIRRSTGIVRSQWLDLRTVLASPAWMTAIAGPPAAYFLAAGIVFARRRASRDPLAARRRRASARATRAIAQAARLPVDQIPAAVSAALRRFVADLAGRPEHGLTAEESIALVSAADPAIAARLDSLLRRCETAQFAPRELGAAGPNLVEEARDLVAQVRLARPAQGEGDSGGRIRPAAPTVALIAVLLLLLTPAARADGAAANPDDLLAGAAAAYDAGVARLSSDRAGANAQFQQAAATYKALIDEGHISGPLFFNLGNALLQSGDTGRAILAYRRAERLMPFDKDLKTNLAAARERLGAGALPVPPARPEQPVLDVARVISPRLRMEAFVVLFGGAWLLALGRLLGVRPVAGWWTIGAFAAVGVLPLASLVAEDVADGADRRGVIVAAAETRSGPGDLLYEPGAPASLPPGTEFSLRSAQPVGAGWSQVRLGNGAEVWVRRDTLELVAPGR